MTVCPPTGQTPLHLAASCGNREVMRHLVDAKADVNVQDSKSGKTSLHHSIERGDLPMAGYLISEVGLRVWRDGGGREGRKDGPGEAPAPSHTTL